MRKNKNRDWQPADLQDRSWERAQCEVLQDIREELQKLNRVFECFRFLQIPAELAAIRRNTTKKRRRKV